MPQGKRRPWTDADKTMLIYLWEVIGSVALIAIMMQRSPSSVQTQASRVGLPPREEQKDRHRRRWVSTDDEHLNALMDEMRLEDGRIPIQDVSERMGRSVDAIVARLLDVHGEDSDIMSKMVAPAPPPPPADARKPGSSVQKPKAGSESQPGDAKRKGRVQACLKCRKPFWSDGNHNWVCINCKRSDDWDF